jgi:hypothetical protein
MAERILPTKAQAPASIPHAYNDPDLSATEFLSAVMHATHLPMSTRIEAASALLPYTNSVPSKVQGYVSHRCKIIIGGLGPCDPAHGSASGSTEICSQDLNAASKTVARDGKAVAFLNIEKTPEPSPLIDYSTPPTPAELQEIKAAINKLRPDLAHLPVPEPRFCHCGHWVVGYYPCCEHERDPSKMN